MSCGGGSSSAARAQPVEDAQGDGRWMSMHQRFVSEAGEKEPEVVFIGDSLLANMLLTEVWVEMFEPLHSLNFGVNGDQTQNVLWRIENGELDNMAPKAIVVLVGTNNYAHSAEEVCDGICAIVSAARARQPQALIVVVSIPPRGHRHNPLRVKIGEINHSLSRRLLSLDNVRFLNIDPGLFLNANDDTISHHDMHDYLHFTPTGYRKFCEPILDELLAVLKPPSSSVEAASHASDSAAPRYF